MKPWLLQALLALVLGTAGLTLCPLPVAASPLAPATLAPVAPPAPLPLKPAVADDFSDADYTQADQSSLGHVRGGVVVVFVGGLIVLLVVILLVLLILDAVF